MKSHRHSSKITALLFLALSAFSAHAEDVELFMAANDGTGVKPNVLFMLDNSANWGASLLKVNESWITKRDVIHEALYQVIMGPNAVNRINAGFMTFTTSTGGKVTSAVKLLDTNYQTILRRKIYGAEPWTATTTLLSDREIVPTLSKWNSYYYQVTQGGITGSEEPVWPTVVGAEVTDGTVVYKNVGMVYSKEIEEVKSYNNAPYALMLNEAYLYFRGAYPYSGKLDSDYDPAAFSGSYYVSPSAPTSCEKNFVILIGSGGPDSAENLTAYYKLRSLYASSGIITNPKPIPLVPDNYQSNWADEYASYFTSAGDIDLVEADRQPLTVYVIDVYDTSANLTKPQKGARAFLNSIANQGRGRYFAASNTSQVASAIDAILKEVAEVNSVFASTTLPVSVNVRGTNLNQVYMGVFRPDASSDPNWYGNLKMYQLAYDAGTKSVFLADKAGVRADSPVTGFIVPSGVSFWTHRTDPAEYLVVNAPNDTQWWWWSERGSTVEPKSDLEDGDIVEKGGAGQWIREHPGGRKLFTCHAPCGAGTTLQEFNATNVTATDIDADPLDHPDIIDYVIGDNSALVDGDERVRAKVHGDVLHSRPGTINYGPTDDDVVVYYGSDDGIFHATKGGEGASVFGGATYAAGAELWGFVPPEHFTSLPKMYHAFPIDYSLDPAVRNPKPYFVDGTVLTANLAGKHYVYLTMRRGGRSIYALEVDDKNGVPPRIAWRHTESTLKELGQTWSDPTVFQMNINGVEKPVMVLGAGYDPVEDFNQPNTMGRGIYVLDAVTGVIIKFLGNVGNEAGIASNVTLAHSIPGAVTSSGDTDYTTGLQKLATAYAGDTGGNIWKLNFKDPNPESWTMTLMASLGGAAADNRKFLFQPDVVLAPGYTGLAIGSGDRENPNSQDVYNYFYMLKDFNDSSLNTWPLTMTSLPLVTAASAGLYTSASPGWKFRLQTTGEKTVGSAITLDGTIYFNTHVPSGISLGLNCYPSLGEARAYAINFANGSATIPYRVAPGGGFLPSPVPFTVTLDDGNGGKTTQMGTLSGTQVSTSSSPNYGTYAHDFRYKSPIDDY